MKTHKLKTWPQYFDDLRTGKKSFELRKNDRRFAVGDVLMLEEYDPMTKTYSGKCLLFDITYIHSNATFGLRTGFVILGLRRRGVAG